MSYFFIKTQINNLCRAVKVYEDEEINIGLFVERALRAHELDARQIEDLDFSIVDSDNMPIDDIQMIKQWKLDSSFKVFIELIVSRNNVELVAESLTNYMKKTNCDNLFDEHDVIKYLTPHSRRKLIKCLVSFIEEEYGTTTSECIKIVCQATISLFSSLKTTTSTIGGIDLLYDPQRKSGYLYFALNYSNKKRKVAKPLQDDTKIDDEDKDEVLKFFKRCVMPKDRAAVEKMMRDTTTTRRYLILNQLEKYRECWNFYFSAPDLVLLDFKLMFENQDDMGLIQKWPKIKNVPFERYGIRIDKSKYTVTRKDDDIFKMFSFLSLIPTPRYSFDKAVNGFLVHTENPNADPMTVRNKKLNSPNIVAIFSVLHDRAAYYIDIQDGIFALPSDYTFVQAVDILIKMHNVFNFEYAKEFSKLMYFFEYVIYGFQQSKRFLTTRMLEVADTILKAEYDKLTDD